MEFDENALQQIRRVLIHLRETISIAESATSGLLQFAMSNTNDTVDFFAGGITVYNLEQKVSQLSVEAIHALSVNCVSQKVAEEMAVAVRLRFSTSYGISITGYASPVPESEYKLFAYYSIACQEGIMAQGRMETSPLSGSGVQLYYVNTILQIFSGKLAAISNISAE